MTKWITRSIVLKYVLLFVVLGSAAVWLNDADDDAFTRAQFASGLFYAALTSTIVTLMYDLIVRSELRALSRAELEEHQQLLLDELSGSLLLDEFTDERRMEFAKRVVESPQTMECVSEELVGSQGEGAEFYRGWIEPLVEGGALREVLVTNRLEPCDEAGCYVMDFRQRFQKLDGSRSYIVVFTSDNGIYENFITSSVEIGEMVGTSGAEWHDIDLQVESLSMVASGGQDGRASRTVRARKLGKRRLSELLDVTLDDNLVRAYEFVLEDDPQVTYEYSYRVRNRLADPFYVWTAVRPTFVRRLTIDYSALKSEMGRVTANSIVNRTSHEPVHDETHGSYIVDVDSLLWPGQGAFIIWRPLPNEDPSVVETAAEDET